MVPWMPTLQKSMAMNTMTIMPGPETSALSGMDKMPMMAAGMFAPMTFCNSVLRPSQSTILASSGMSVAKESDRKGGTESGILRAM